MLQAMSSQGVRHDLATGQQVYYIHTHTHSELQEKSRLLLCMEESLKLKLLTHLADKIVATDGGSLILSNLFTFGCAGSLLLQAGFL